MRAPNTGDRAIRFAAVRTDRPGWAAAERGTAVGGAAAVAHRADIDNSGWPLPRPHSRSNPAFPVSSPQGDMGTNSVKRVAAAAGEGAMSVPMIHRYLAAER
jgi:hypothetical protein